MRISVVDFLIRPQEYVNDVILVDGAFLWRSVVTNQDNFIYRHLKIVREFFHKVPVVVLDAPGNIRKVLDDTYKAQREETEERKLVRKRSELLWENNYFPTIRLPGFEADDLIAYLVLAAPGLCVLSGDKDLFQLPGLEMYTYNKKRPHNADESILKKNFEDSFPKYLLEYFTPGAQAAIVQALYGDRADNIPRLLPKKKKMATMVLDVIFCSENHIQEAYNTFGKQFIQNLEHVIMPHYMLYKDEFDIMQFSDVYYNYNNFNLKVEYSHESEGIVVL